MQPRKPGWPHRKWKDAARAAKIKRSAIVSMVDLLEWLEKVNWTAPSSASLDMDLIILVRPD
jgi:hypothetical protein